MGAWLLPYQIMVLLLFGLTTLCTEMVCLVAGLWDRDDRAANQCLRGWARICLGMAGLEVKVQGLERIDPERTYVFMPNHASFLDILLALAYIPQDFRFIILWKLFFNPLLSMALRSSGHLPIDRRNPRQSLRTLQRAMELLARDVSIVVFPEGTRSRTGELQEFKTMLFVLPIRAKVPVVPVLIDGTFAALARGRVLLRPVELRMTFLEPVADPAGHFDRSTYARKVREALQSAHRAMGVPENSP